VGRGPPGRCGEVNMADDSKICAAVGIGPGNGKKE
jgi:hypothetical protein